MINSLPSEILAKIFHAGTELDDPRARPCLITYGSVSSRWRTICHSSPELWTNIRIPFHQRARQDVVAWTAAWLERSKSCLFDLTVDFPSPEMYPDIIRPLHNSLHVLIPHVSRLRRLHFNAHADCSLAALILEPLSSEALEAPQLVDLHLQFLTDDVDSAIFLWNILPLAFNSAPRLQRQTIRGAAIQYPLRGLTSLEIHDVIPDEPSFRDLSLQSPGLKELSLIGLHPLLEPTDINHLVVFPALQALTISFARMNFTPDTSILALMSPPNLHSLHIRGPNLPEATASFPNPANLTNLHTLCLEEIAVFLRLGVTFAPFCFALPSVKHLQLISTSPQPLFPVEPVEQRKPLLRSRSGELRSRTTNNGSGALPNPFQAPVLAPRAAEIDFRLLSKDKTQPIKLPFSLPDSDSSKSKSKQPYTHWPNLTTITLDTIRARDLLWLCELVAARTEIETVYLSRSAKRHLASSLSIKRGDEKNKAKEMISCWELAERRPLVRLPMLERGDKDPVQWLQEHVKVLDFHPSEQT